MTTPPGGTGAMSAPAARRATEDADALWLGVSDALLRGVAHTLSNRTASLGALASVLEPGEPWDAELSASYRSEVARLDEVMRLVRLLPRDRRTAPEPVQLPELLPDVLALHAIHPDLRAVPTTVEGDAQTQPLWVNRSGLVHALLVLLDAVKRAAQATPGGGVRLRYGGDEREVWITLASDPAAAPSTPAAPPDPELVRCLLARGVPSSPSSDVLPRVTTNGGGAARVEYRVCLETLLAARRREGRSP